MNKISNVTEEPAEKSLPVIENIQPESVPIEIEKPDGMTPDAKVAFDELSEVKPEKATVSSSSVSPRSPSLQSRINRIENKLTAKMKKIIKRRRKNVSAKKSRRKNRKK